MWFYSHNSGVPKSWLLKLLRVKLRVKQYTASFPARVPVPPELDPGLVKELGKEQRLSWLKHTFCLLPNPHLRSLPKLA